MNQTRTFLIFAWMMVAVLLWMEWGKDKNPPPAATETTQQAPSAGSLPGMVSGSPDAAIPSAAPVGAANVPAVAAVAAPAANDHRVTITTDVLRLTLDGSNVFDAELLRYPQAKAEDSPPVKLLDEDPAHYYVAKSGWVGQGGAPVPDLAPATPQRQITLADGQQTAEVSFVSPPNGGVSIRRTYTLTRGSYAIAVHDEVVNESGKPWQGYIYRQLARIPPQTKSGMTNP